MSSLHLCNVGPHRRVEADEFGDHDERDVDGELADELDLAALTDAGDRSLR